MNGLVAVVFTGLSNLGSLNRVFAAGLQPPVVAPTPLVQAVVLPDGHTPPDAAGKSRPNEAEIPEHLRPLRRSMVNLPTPLPVAEQAIHIQIPAIGVDSPMVQGDSWEQLKADHSL